jgi:hypothetical protein
VVPGGQERVLVGEERALVDDGWVPGGQERAFVGEESFLVDDGWVPGGQERAFVGEESFLVDDGWVPGGHEGVLVGEERALVDDGWVPGGHEGVLVGEESVLVDDGWVPDGKALGSAQRPDLPRVRGAAAHGRADGEGWGDVGCAMPRGQLDPLVAELEMEDRVTLWVGPLDAGTPPPGVTYVSGRTFHAYDRFARSRGDAAEAVEQGSALGAVLADRYSHWKNDWKQRRFPDVFGPKSLAPALAPHLVPGGLVETDHGTLYESTPPLSLPAAVAFYLSVYARVHRTGP